MVTAGTEDTGKLPPKSLLGLQAVGHIPGAHSVGSLGVPFTALPGGKACRSTAITYGSPPAHPLRQAAHFGEVWTPPLAAEQHLAPPSELLLCLTPHPGSLTFAFLSNHASPPSLSFSLSQNLSLPPARSLSLSSVSLASPSSPRCNAQLLWMPQILHLPVRLPKLELCFSYPRLPPAWLSIDC